ncbi:MAG: family 43 glycosylhydrolase [Deltaproteobacteria bacterium]|nr:family 43 glycosylhydrolase [Deltaproteobacteria bacterium]
MDPIAAAALATITVNNINDVRGNLTLPTTASGLSITWTSGEPSIISADGIVNRPANESVVALTATAVNGEGKASLTLFARVRAAVNLGPLEGYVFAYFTGNSLAGENIHFAASRGNDALKWDELNGGQPLFTSSYGSKGLRDPFIIRSPEGDTFYLIATDLSIGSGTSWDEAQRQGSLYLEVWESHDLVNWSEQRHVKVSPDTAGNTWAPEAYYSEDLGSYVVFWASKLYDENDPNHTGSTYNRMLYATTRDFITFSQPQIWQDGISRIDSTVIKSGDVYHRFTKDEGAGTTGCSDIIQETATELTAPLSEWTMIDSCIGNNAGTSAVEGPSIFKSNPGDVNGDYHYLFVDEYGGRGYIPLRTADIGNPAWTVAPSYALPAAPRHGTVLPVTADELDRLRAQINKWAPPLPGLYADPNAVSFGDSYYIYTTTDGYPGWGGKDFYVWSSSNLADWTRSEEPFLTLDGANGNVPWATGNAWAPTIIARDGKYFFYFSGHNPTYDRKTIGVAIADSPLGPFVAEPEAMILNNEDVTTGQAIDPAAFQDPETGKYYLFWGNGGALYAELADEMTFLVPGTIRPIAGLPDFREGTFVVYREGLYHLTYSIDDTGSPDYRVGYATAQSVDGPWTSHGVILSKKTTLNILGTGHNSILKVPGADEWYIVYHRFAIPDGGGTERETTIDRLSFDPETGLMQVVTPTLTGVIPRGIVR